LIILFWVAGRARGIWETKGAQILEK